MTLKPLITLITPLTVITLIGRGRGKKMLYIVMEFAAGGVCLMDPNDPNGPNIPTDPNGR